MICGLTVVLLGGDEALTPFQDGAAVGGGLGAAQAGLAGVRAGALLFLKELRADLGPVRAGGGKGRGVAHLCLRVPFLPSAAGLFIGPDGRLGQSASSCSPAAPTGCSSWRTAALSNHSRPRPATL